MDEVTGNIYITKLAQIEKMSTRSTNVCCYNGLKDLNSLVNYYWYHGNFRKLRGCGKKSNLKLTRICKKYENLIDPFLHNIDSLTTKQKNVLNVLIYDLFEYLSYESRNFLTYRLVSINIDSIRSHNLKDSSDLIKGIYVSKVVIDEMDKFIGAIKNLVENINQVEKLDETKFEILKMFSNDTLKLNSIFTGEIDWALYHPFLLSIDSLTTKQKNILNILIYELFENLSYKSKNTLTSHLGSINLDSIRSHGLIDSSEFITYRYVGKVTIFEIDQFISAVKKLVEGVNQIKDLDRNWNETLKKISKNKLTSDSAFFFEIKEMYDSCRIPIFQILNMLIENENIFTHRERSIFKTSYYTNTQKYTVTKLREEFGITKDSIRRIRHELSNFSRLFYFLNKLRADDILLYGIDCTAYYIEVDDDVATKFNEAESTNFTHVFIAKILSIILSDKYFLLSNNPKLEFSQDSKVPKVHNTYLISKTHANKFNFAKFLKDVKIRLLRKIKEDYSINLETYLLQFFNGKSTSLNNETIQIAKNLLLNEYNLKTENGNIIFKRNALKLVIEYIIEALEKKVEPLSLKELFEVINQYSRISKNILTLRQMCYMDDRIISLQKGTMFGLKKWGEDRNIKGGRILDLIYDFLQQKSTPIHISELVKYVNRSRETTTHSIRVNLKHDARKRFIQYCGSYWGLASKEYPKEFIVKTN